MNKIKRIAAMIGVIILVGMYVITLILGLTASPATQNMLMASIVCTVVIPVMLYAMMLVARVLGSSNDKNPPNDENPEAKHSGKKNSSSKKSN